MKGKNATQSTALAEVDSDDEALEKELGGEIAAMLQAQKNRKARTQGGARRRAWGLSGDLC